MYSSSLPESYIFYPAFFSILSLALTVLMLVLAVTVEGIVQYIKSIIEMVTKKDYKTAVTQLSALVISVALCLMAGADVYGALGVTFAGGWAGMVLTGVFASRGANYAADIIKRLQGAKTGETTE